MTGIATAGSGEPPKMTSQPKGGIRRRRAPLVVAITLVMTAALLTSASSASAISIGMMWSTNPSESEMNVVQHSGATTFRMPIEINSTNNGANWSIYDAAFNAAWTHGIRIEPYLVRSTSEGNRFLLSSDPGWSAWYTWVRNAVKRYGVNGEFWAGKANPKPATTWEIWNEPNLPENNPGGTKVQPEEYGGFLVYTSAAIAKGAEERGQSRPTVLFGGLYMPGGFSYNAFLEQASNVPGVSTSYDGVGIHPYAFSGKLSEMTGHISSVRSALNSKVLGGSGKSLWINELGWPVAGSGQPTVSLSEQASLLTQSFDWIKANAASNNIQLVMWYNLHDGGVPGRWDAYCGLIDSNDNFRPAWAAFQAQTGAPAWPQESVIIPGEDDSFPGPKVIGRANGTIDVFYRKPGGVLGHNWLGSGGGWASGDLPGSVASVPHAVVQSNGTIDVFYRTPNGELGHNWYDAGGAGWMSGTLPGSVASDPHPIVQANGTIDVFYRTPSGGLGHNWYDTGGAGWMSGTLAGSVALDPYPVIQTNGTIDVFYKTSTGGLGHNWLGSGGGTWGSGTLPGSVNSVPHAIAQPNGTIDVFWRTPSGELGHDWYDTGGAGWLGGSLPGLLSLGPPKVTTQEATSIGSNKATVNALINPEGIATSYYFEVGTNPAFGGPKIPASPSAIGSGNSDVSVSQTPTGLSPNTTYYYRVVAINSEGTTFGNGQTLKTAP